MSRWSYQAPLELSDEQYARWQTLLELRTGICFLQHKSILQKGLSQRMREVGCEDYEEYFQQVSRIPEGLIEWTQLVDRISVKETSFYRESHSYGAVQKYLMTLFELESRSKGDTLDLWSVGCSTGEEAYSLAMLANEVLDYVSTECFLGVMATDISQSALAVARLGKYSARKVDSLPPSLKHKYFTGITENQYQVVAKLRQRLAFVQGNLLELDKIPQLAMDVIYCQNVLVYFRRDRQWQVLNGLAEHLKPGGLLVIGPGEVVGWQHPKMQRYKDTAVQAYIKISLKSQRAKNGA
ncbi:protein-glutamate O-methyltransferase CheR [Oceanicoccus sp. KOV_DT_Chl]|uniref:CheR family methyltransferase n=1 Tax=Oceanicoccus sp. KOV_DT_Chl TaxID=1904639 RepID=UPI000C7AC6ED|nr:CheR family methyltransferase [Oceanicoccus sp. KOV_DT_Chl]